jgi:aminoglycoside 2''-phosphotransferase
VDSYSARKLIEKCFPQIKVRHSRQIVTGWENFVLEVNRKYIFRFPKYKETEKRLASEIESLPALRRQISVEVPNYEFVWRGGRKYPRWFGGYRKISGVTIGSSNLGKERLRPVAAQIADFLKQLHRIRSRGKQFPHIPSYSPAEWLRSTRAYYRKIRRVVYPVLNYQLRARSETFWQKFFSELREANFEPTLIHGDLGGENILFDPVTGRLTGILDWSYLQVSDPAFEFAHLFIYKPALGDEVLRHYKIRGSNMKKRIQWYVDSEPFYDILWGVSHHWDRAKKLGLTQLTKTLPAEV